MPNHTNTRSRRPRRPAKPAVPALTNHRTVVGILDPATRTRYTAEIATFDRNEAIEVAAAAVRKMLTPLPNEVADTFVASRQLFEAFTKHRAIPVTPASAIDHVLPVGTVVACIEASMDAPLA